MVTTVSAHLIFAIAAFVIAFGITAAIGPSVITALRRLKVGQKILEIGPKWHMNKQNIPTMGGVMFVFGSLVAATAVMLAAPYFYSRLNPHSSSMIFVGNQYFYSFLAILGLSLANMVIGFIDDRAKIRKQRNLGLTALQKSLLQIAVAVLFVTLMRNFGLINPHFTIPFLNVSLTMPWPVYIVVATFIIVGTVNSVNITDGVDGLAGGVTFLVAVFFAAAALFMLRMSQSASLTGVSILASALAGALMGYLIYNFHPAKVIMGDTGSLFLGAAVCGFAFAIDLPLILIPVGIVYVIDTLSVIIQVSYFKLTHGKRIFKMSPIHHSFEMSGYTEWQIVIAAYVITAVGCALAYWGVRLLY